SDEDIAVTIRAPEQHHRVVSKAVIQCCKPLSCPALIKVRDNMHITPKRREELACGQVPVTIQPCPALPPTQPFQHPLILRIIESVVAYTSRHKPRLRFLLLQKRKHEPCPIPRMTNPARIRRRINPRSPVRLASATARRDILVLPTRQRRRLLNPD